MIGFRAVDNRLRQHFKAHPKGSKSGSTVVGFLVAQQGRLIHLVRCVQRSHMLSNHILLHSSGSGLFDMKLVNCGDSRGVIIDGEHGFAEDVEAPQYLACHCNCCSLVLGYEVDAMIESTDAVVCHDIGSDQTFFPLLIVPCGAQATSFDCLGNQPHNKWNSV
eukprot:2805083-Amphidinium_carterae.1